MSTNFGDIDIRITANDSDYQKTVKKVSKQLDDFKKQQGGATKSTSGMTKSVLKANIAFAAMAKVASFAIKGISAGYGKAIKSATNFAEEQSKLNTVFKGIQSTANETRDNLVSNYGLSRLAATQLTAATGDLLTGLNFTQEAALGLSEQTQQMAVDLASFSNAQGGAEAVSVAITKALLGERESLKTYGIAIGEADVKNQLLRDGKADLTGEALRQAKAEATLTLIYAQSKNAVGDYARTTESLANIERTLAARTEDIAVTMGQTLLPVVTDIKGDMLDLANSFLEFSKTEAGIKTLATTAGLLSGSFAVIKTVASEMFRVFKDVGMGIIEDVKGVLGEFGETAAGGVDIFDAFGAAVQIGLILPLNIVGSVVKNVLAPVKRLISGIGLASEGLSKFAKGDFIGAAVASKEAMANMAEGVADILVPWELVRDVGGDLINSFQDIAKTSDKMRTSFDTAYLDAYQKSVDAATQKVLDLAAAEETTEEETKNANAELKKQEDLLKLAAERASKLRGLYGGLSGEIVKDFAEVKKIFEETGGALEEGLITKTERLGAVMGSALNAIDKGVSFVANSINDAIQSIGDTIQASIDSQIDANNRVYENKVALIDQELQMELEKNGLLEETSIEKAENDIASLQEQLATETDEERRKELSILLTKAKAEALKAKIIEAAEKKKQKIAKETAKKNYELELQAFKTRQAMGIIDATIQFATGLVGVWAQSIAQLGPIAGSIVAGILTGVMTGVFAANVAIIASQTPPARPSFETGGVVGGTSYTGDNVAANVNSGEMILTRAQQANLFRQANSSGTGQTINLIMDGDLVKSWFVGNQQVEALS